MWSRFIEFLFPRKCLGCKSEDSALCGSCKAKLVAVFLKRYDGKYYDELMQIFRYGNSKILKILLKKIKYKFDEQLIEILDSHLRIVAKKIPKDQILAYIPLHKSRLSFRGFNQSKLIAELIMKHGDFTMMECVVRIKKTVQQAGLSGNERIKNLNGAFEVKPGFKKLIEGRKFLLIDDVASTGSTLDEAAKVLKEAGALRVDGLVLARG